MKIYLSILFYFFYLGIYAQVTRKIVIVDSITKEPIPFVAIQTSDDDGSYSDKNGVSYVYLDKVDRISLQSIGYKTITLSKENVKDSIFLSPKVEELKEIKVGVKYKQEEIGLHKKSTHFGFHFVPKREFITAITFDSRFIDSYIEKIHVPIKKLRGLDYGDLKAAVRINLYLDCPKQIPLEKNYESQPLYCDINSSGILQFDVSDALLVVTPNCIYVGFELLGFVNENGEILQNSKGTLSVPFTKKKTKEFTSTTYIKLMFTESDEWIPLNNIIEKHTKFNGNYSLPIGFTISTLEEK